MIERDGERYRLVGPVTFGNVSDVLDDGERQFTGPRAVVDFAGVTDADSSALSLMLEWQRRANRRGAKIAFVNLGEGIESLMALYGVADLIPQSTD